MKTYLPITLLEELICYMSMLLVLFFFLIYPSYIW